MQNRKQSKHDHLMFLDEDVSYKTGMDEDENNTLLSYVNKEAVKRQQEREREEQQERILQEQARLKEEQAKAKQAQKEETIQKIEDTKQMVIDTGKKVKKHEQAFNVINKNFKIVFLISILAFIVNCVLSFIGGVFFWGNISNVLGIITIYFIMRHLKLTPEVNERDKQVTQILKQNMAQVVGDYIAYKMPKSLQDKAETIIRVATIITTFALVVLPSNNILYAVSVVISLISIFLLIGMRKFAELNAHLQLLNRASIIGVAAKALIMVLSGKFIELEYLNVALLFVFTYVQFYFKEEASDIE